MKFILDANFLMIPGKFKVDVFEQLKGFGKVEFYTLDLVVREIAKLSKGSSKNSRYAKLALCLLEKESIEIIAVGKKIETDKAIVQFAKKGFVVCTQDRELIKKLKGQGCKVIGLRQKKILEEL